MPQDISLPLSRFGCLLGAEHDVDAGKIRFPGNDSGIIIYGPYEKLDPGLYSVTARVLFPDRSPPQAEFEIYANGRIYVSQTVSTHCSTVELTVYLSERQTVELRVRSHWTRLEVSEVSYSVQGTRLPDGLNYRDCVRKDLMALFSGESKAAKESWADQSTVSDMLFATNAVQAICIDKLHDHEMLFHALGIHTAHIQALFDLNQREVTAGGDQLSDLVRGYPNVTNAFQDHIIQEGFLEIYSPYCAKKLRSSDFIPVNASDSIFSIVYEFLSERPFVVGASTGWIGSLSFIWLIAEDIIVYSDLADSNWVNPEVAISKYVTLCALHFERLRSYRGKPHKVVLASGFISNMGHYFWNETSGLERVLRDRSAHDIKLYERETPWLQISEIFAESLNAKHVISSHEELFDQVITNQELLVRPTGSAYDDALAAKVQNAAEKKFKAKSTELYQTAKSLVESGVEILFVNLRAHNKAWLEQSDGIGRIIAAILEDKDSSLKPRGSTMALLRETPDEKHVRLIVYLDGYKDCEASCEAIRSAGAEGVLYIDGTSAKFEETLYWAFHCNSFIAVIGSGLVPLTWIANKPGICYSDKRHLDQLRWWGKVRKAPALLMSPEPDAVSDEIDVFYANYSIQPMNLVSLMLRLRNKLSSQSH